MFESNFEDNISKTVPNEVLESESNSDWKVEERNFIDSNLIKSKYTISDSKKEENKLNSFYEEDDESENKKLYFIDYVKGGNKLFNSVKMESKGENISTNYSSRKRKRGKAKTKNDNRKHNFDSNDNLQRKIQVHYLTFIVSFVNDLLKNLNYKQRFKNLEYDFKIKIDKISTKSLKNNCIGKIISNNSISEKYKKIKCNEREKYNLKIYNQIIRNKILKKILSEKYLDIFRKIYFKSEKRINLEEYGLSQIINLSNNVKMFKDLLLKDTQNISNNIYNKNLYNCIKKNFLPNLIFGVITNI